MAQQPTWRKILISGSDFEVNSLTSSTDFKLLNNGTDDKDIIFRDPVTGGWEATSSMYWDGIQGTTKRYLNIGDNAASHSVNVPDLPITASVVGQPILDVDNAVLQFPVLFKNSTDGGFERTSSLVYEPFLGYDAFQSTILNTQMRSGSDAFGPNPPVGAVFPDPTQLPAPTFLKFPLTFKAGSGGKGTFSSTPTDESYIDASDGDFMEFRRPLLEGQGITASFQFPLAMTPNGSAWSSQGFSIILRHYDAGSVLDDTGDYTDYGKAITFYDIVDGGTNNPQWGNAYTYAVGAATGSATGSFEIDGPINVGDKFQLFYQRSGTNLFFFGYSGSVDNSDIGPYKFEFTGATTLPQDTLVGNFSGSFAGNIPGGSGSLTGVEINDIPSSDGLKRGKGIIFITDGGQGVTTFTGNSEVTMSLRLNNQNTIGNSGGNKNRSGLELSGMNDSDLFGGVFELGSFAGGLRLAEGLPIDGLGYALGGNDRSQIQINLDGSNSGLKMTSSRLSLPHTLMGQGLEGSFGLASSSGSMSIELREPPGFPSGLGFGVGPLAASDALSLDGLNLAGNGLAWGGLIGEYDDLDIDTNVVAQKGQRILLKAATPNATLDMGNTAGGTSTFVSVSYTNNNTLRQGYVDIKTTINRPPTTIVGDVTVSGNFTVVDENNVTSIWAGEFETTDPFIHLNSGSSTVAPFNFDNGGFIIQTSSDASGSAIWFDLSGGSNLVIGGKTFFRAGWGLTNGGVPWDAQSPFYPFDSAASVADARDSDYAANMSMVKIGDSNLSAGQDPNSIGIGLQPFYEHSTLDNLGSIYIDTGSDPLGDKSNVYIYGIFD
jgi:hypothetical protein